MAVVTGGVNGIGQGIVFASDPALQVTGTLLPVDGDDTASNAEVIARAQDKLAEAR